MAICCTTWFTCWWRNWAANIVQCGGVKNNTTHRPRHIWMVERVTLSFIGFGEVFSTVGQSVSGACAYRTIRVTPVCLREYIIIAVSRCAKILYSITQRNLETALSGGYFNDGIGAQLSCAVCIWVSRCVYCYCVHCGNSSKSNDKLQHFKK